MSTDLQALATFLAKTPFFGGLAEEPLNLLAGMLVPRDFDAGATVFKQGDSGRSMYVIHTGTAVVGRTGDKGNFIKLFNMGPGAFFGETTIIEMQPRPHTVLMREAGRLYELTNAHLYKFYQSDIHAYVMVLQNINRELCRRLRRSDTRLTEWADEADDPVTQIRTRDELAGGPKR